MILVSSDDVHGREIVRTLGLVRGNSVRARHLGRDVLAFMKNLVGGEIDDYTKLIAESRVQSVDRMVAEARALGANAIVSIRFATSEVSSGAAEILVYGTAVALAPERA